MKERAQPRGRRLGDQQQPARAGRLHQPPTHPEVGDGEKQATPRPRAASLLAWATGRRPRRGRTWRKGETIGAVAALLVAAVAVVALVRTAQPEPGPLPQTEAPTATGRGDPILAKRLVDQARDL